MAGRKDPEKVKASDKKVAKTNRAEVKGFTSNEERLLYQMASAIAVRASIAARMGKSFSDDRDIYTALGYPKQPNFNDYMARYRRQDVARAIIDAPVGACWRHPPRITESKEEETEFEQKWIQLVKSRGLYNTFSRLDKLASIGTYAVLLLGFDDKGGFSAKLKSANSLLYSTPYSQENAGISTYDTDKKSPRYGQPEKYNITMKSTANVGTISPTVHSSRIIHVAEDLLEDNLEGMPGLEGILNRLIDLERVAGASSEMFWRGGFPGYGFKLDPGATIGDQGLIDLQDEIEDYMHDLKRYIRLRGMSVESLAMQVADPSNHVSILIDLIACAKRIPKRILMGSERGELASSQDERAWNERIDERRRDHCETVILRPFIDRLIEAKILPTPEKGYTVDWSELGMRSEKEKAEVAQAKSAALKNYVEAIGAQDIVPPDLFLRKIMGFSDEEVEEANRMIDDMQRNEPPEE